MLTAKIKPTLLKNNINNIGFGFKQTNDVKKLLNSPNSPSTQAWLKQMEKEQSDFIRKKIASGLFGWVNDPINDQMLLVEGGTGKAILSLDGSIVINYSHKQLQEIVFPYDLMVKTLISKDSEGLMKWPYRDSGGNVTIGGGKLISHWGDFKTIHEDMSNGIAFRMKDLSLPTDEDFKTAFDQVLAFNPDNFDQNDKKAYNNYIADRFKDASNLRLPEEAGKALVLYHLKNEVVNRLQKSLPEFSSFPSFTQMAIADIVYNIGIGKKGGTKGFLPESLWPKFKQALQYRDFATAAHESSRGQVAKIRNDNVKAWLTAASKEERHFLDTGVGREKAKQIQADLKSLKEVPAPEAITGRFN